MVKVSYNEEALSEAILEPGVQVSTWFILVFGALLHSSTAVLLLRFIFSGVERALRDRDVTRGVAGVSGAAHSQSARVLNSPAA